MSDNTERRPMRRGPGGPHGPGPRVAEKPKDFKKAMGKLILFIKPFIAVVVVALAFAVAGTVLNLVGPNVLSDLTDAIQAAFLQGGVPGAYEMDMAKVTQLCVLLVCIYGAGLICSYVQGVIMATVTQKNSRNLRTAISQKINLLPLRYFDSNSIGDILSRVTNDVDTIGQTLNQSVTTFVTAVVMLIGSIVMMFVTNWITSPPSAPASSGSCSYSSSWANRRSISRGSSGFWATSTATSRNRTAGTTSSRRTTPRKT